MKRPGKKAEVARGLSDGERRFVQDLSARHCRVRVWRDRRYLKLSRNPIDCAHMIPRRHREEFWYERRTGPRRVPGAPQSQGREAEEPAMKRTKADLRATLFARLRLQLAQASATMDALHKLDSPLNRKAPRRLHGRVPLTTAGASALVRFKFKPARRGGKGGGSR